MAGSEAGHGEWGRWRLVVRLRQNGVIAFETVERSERRDLNALRDLALSGKMPYILEHDPIELNRTML